MNKFTLGIAAGMTSLAVAVPLVAQMAGAAMSADTVMFTAADEARMVDFKAPSQACIGAMADMESAQLANFDSISAQRKSAMQTRVERLRQVAAIADDDARSEAMKTMHEELMDKEMPEQPQAVQDAMEALKEACDGDMFFFHGGPHGGFGMAMGVPGERFEMKLMKGGNFAEKLGMTEEEIKAALESGKTIEELAEEKGIELPIKIKRFRHFSESEAIEQ